MFLIDKYTPTHIDDVFFHKDTYDMLRKMAKDDSIPHIIFHGMPGVGKKTMINIFLELLFDSSVHNTYEVTYKVTGSSNKTNNETIKKSDYHIVIQPKNTNYDRYLIHNVVKDYAKRVGFKAYKSKRSFKIIQIDNLDNFTYYAQTSLRRTIENYSDKCRFIMWCNSLSNVIRPIQSRCTCIRLPCPTESQMLDYLCYISAMEGKTLPLNVIHNIISTSNGYIKGVLWKLQDYWADIDFETDYDRSIKRLVDFLLMGQIDKIDGIRDIIFKLYITTFTHDKIIEDMMNNIMIHPDLDDDIKIKIVVRVSELEYNLIRGRRAIIHFDSIAASIMAIIDNSKRSKKLCINDKPNKNSYSNDTISTFAKYKKNKSDSTMLLQS